MMVVGCRWNAGSVRGKSSAGVLDRATWRVRGRTPPERRRPCTHAPPSCTCRGLLEPVARGVAEEGDLEVIRVLVADDHILFRGGLRGLLRAEPGTELVSEATNRE